MKRAALLCMIVVCLLIGSGCWDRREVNDVAIVIAMAIDKEKGGLYRLSVQVPLVSHLGGPTGGGGGTGGDKSYYVDSAVGQTIRDAHNIIQSRMSRHLYYAHHRVVVIGEQLAKEGFGEVLDIISRFPENRLTAYIVMTRGKAFRLLQAQPQFERFSGEAIRELVKAVTIPITIKDISQMLNTPGVDAFLPIFEPVDTKPKGKSKEIEATGIATFRDDKLAATYSSEEIKGLRWFQRSFAPYTTVVNLDDKQKLSIDIYKGKANIYPLLRNGAIHFQVKVYGTAIVVENLTTYNLSKKEVVTAIESKLEKEVTDNIKRIFDQIKKTRSDSIGLGIDLARKYPREWKATYRDRWNEVIPKITYKIDCKVQISNVGQTTTNITKEEPQ